MQLAKMSRKFKYSGILRIYESFLLHTFSFNRKLQKIKLYVYNLIGSWTQLGIMQCTLWICTAVQELAKKTRDAAGQSIHYTLISL